METALRRASDPKVAPQLLRNDQVADLKEEIGIMETKLKSPLFQGDKGTVRDQLLRATHQLESQMPRPFAQHEIDAAVRRAQELGEQIRADGMLSHEEMRKCPPGAVDAHRSWEKRNIGRILEWKNLQRRIHAGSEDMDVADIEKLRPRTSAMSMDGALIPGKQYHLPPAGAAHPVLFSDEQIAILRLIAPEVAEKLGSLSNVQRADVKEILTDAVAGSNAGLGLADAAETDPKANNRAKGARRGNATPPRKAA